MQLNSKFSRNRAEEYGFDLWTDFVIPPYFKSLELLNSNKPLVVEGGRGTGKTMLIRYLCHKTQFSPCRHSYSKTDFERIGIYWKMDVQFAKLMQLRGENDDLWIHAFIHMGVLIITKEMLDFLNNIKNSIYVNIPELNCLDFSELKIFDDKINGSLDELILYIHRMYNYFQLWVSNYKQKTKPILYPKEFLDELITIVKTQVPILNNATFSVYIDEYENLIPIQKKIINTWIKHSQIPLIFNIAMKHNSLDVKNTLGDEMIVATHDYRCIDLDAMLGKSFNIFASEILLLKIHNDINKPELQHKEWLFDVAYLDNRNKKSYIDKILNRLYQLFPKKTYEEIANDMLSDSAFSGRIWEQISKDLKTNAVLSVNKFKDLNADARAYVVLHALLARGTNAQYVYEELVKYSNGESSKFEDWIHNNLVGCILNQYGKRSRLCPLYAGFDTFIHLSKDNIRHFLELCYASLLQSQVVNITNFMNVDINDQVVAVRNVSQDMLYEVKQFGKYGNALYGITIRIGTIFEFSRKNDFQSEPEQNHFSIKGKLDANTEVLLNELIKWSVVYVTKLTKQKNVEYGEEYQLNPIYAPYFMISYRKKRRIEFSAKDFQLICIGTETEFNEFLRNKQWNEKVDNTEQLTLF